MAGKISSGHLALDHVCYQTSDKNSVKLLHTSSRAKLNRQNPLNVFEALEHVLTYSYELLSDVMLCIHVQGQNARIRFFVPSDDDEVLSGYSSKLPALIPQGFELDR